MCRPAVPTTINLGTHLRNPKSVWKTKPVITKRTANFVYGMFKRAKKKGWYVGENPGDTTKDSELGEALGPQPPGGHHRDLKVKYIPQLMAYLRTPRYPRSHQHSDEYCTVSEAMEATGVGREAINRAIRMGRLPGSYKERGYDWQQAPYLIPVAGLKELTPLLQPIRSHAKITLHAHILQYLILDAVRADGVHCAGIWLTLMVRAPSTTAFSTSLVKRIPSCPLHRDHHSRRSRTARHDAGLTEPRSA